MAGIPLLQRFPIHVLFVFSDKSEKQAAVPLLYDKADTSFYTKPLSLSLKNK